ncbi:MAG: hypothetical protein ACK42H_19520, partial [Planctomycetota bacterium]
MREQRKRRQKNWVSVSNTRSTTKKQNFVLATANRLQQITTQSYALKVEIGTNTAQSLAKASVHAGFDLISDHARSPKDGAGEG